MEFSPDSLSSLLRLLTLPCASTVCSAEEEATLLIEQARDAKHAPLRATILMRALGLIQNAIEEEAAAKGKPASAEGEAEKEKKQVLLKRLGFANEIFCTGFESHQVPDHQLPCFSCSGPIFVSR